jgi:hypothetical protein
MLRRTIDQEAKPMKAITAVIGGALALLTATGAMLRWRQLHDHKPQPGAPRRSGTCRSLLTS